MELLDQSKHETQEVLDRLTDALREKGLFMLLHLLRQSAPGKPNDTSDQRSPGLNSRMRAIFRCSVPPAVHGSCNYSEVAM
jgi:hypothetical protein